MTIKAWYDVWCDGEDCNAWLAGGPTPRRAIANATTAGWRQFPGGRWLCWSCRDALLVEKRVEKREEES